MAEIETSHRDPLGWLLEISRKQQTGILRVTFGPCIKQISVREGLLAYAESNAQDDHLVHVLVRMKLIPRSAIRPVASLMKDGLTADQAVCRAANLGASELEKGLREQAVRILCSILGQHEARSHFYEGNHLLHKHVSLGESIPQLLLIAARRAVAERQLPSSLIAPTGYLMPADSDGDPGCLFPLDSPEAYALQLVREPTSYDRAVQMLAPTGNEPGAVLRTLVLLGLLRLDARGPERDPSKITDDDWLRLELDRLLERCETASLYEILHVTRDATEAEIKASYHNLAMKYHPDRYRATEHGADLHAKAGKLFSWINEAHSTLSNAESRAAYDAELARRESRITAAIQARSSTDNEQEKIAAGLYRAGRVALAEGDYEKAVTHLKQCVWLRPEVAGYHHYLAVAQKENPRLYKEAEGHLLRAIELDSASIDSRLELGKLYLKVHLPRRAAAQFEEVLRWMPTHEEALNLLKSTK
ncbi:MAG: DnaJ domain-containing protein [Acidobacteria bacterium]|nr:DnaJ domain-containing protein [Acidobacteriota bacterium]